jgi:hypothetical protein
MVAVTGDFFGFGFDFGLKTDAFFGFLLIRRLLLRD